MVLLTAGMRIVAAVSIALAMVNSTLLLIHLLTAQVAAEASDRWITYALLGGQVAIALVGGGLLRMYRSAWIAFWPVGLISLGLAGELAHWIAIAKGGEVESIPFFVAVAMTLWFLASGICLLLPSSRMFYFNEPDQVWMHKKVFRKAEEAATSVSGRPRKPVGVTILGCVSNVFAALVFVYAMSQLAGSEVEGEEATQPLSDPWATGMIVFSLALIVASIGLFRTKRWGWFSALACGAIAIGGAAALVVRGMQAAQAGALIGTPAFSMCLLWCGSGVFYLLLPKVRSAFFSRGRRRY